LGEIALRPLPDFGALGTVVVVVLGAVVVVVTTVVVGEMVVVVSLTIVVVVSGIVVVGSDTVVVVVVVGESSGVSTRFTIGVEAVLFVFTKRAFTSLGARAGFIDRTRAASPATCGDAIEVPEMVLVAVLPEIHAEVICEPGAHMSTHDPKFEYEARESRLSMAPIVMAPGTRAGE
jgi:hypothetical protein